MFRAAFPFLVVLLLAGVGAAAPSPPSDTTIVLPFVRTIGSAYMVEIQKTQEERSVGEMGEERVLSRVQRSWDVEVEVRGSRPGGYALSWTYRPEHRHGVRSSPAYDRVTGTLENVRLVFATDSAGRPQFVLNPQWVRSHLNEALSVVAGRVPPSEQPRLDAVRDQAMTSAGLRSLFLGDAERLTFLNGRELPLGQTVSTATEVRNPFGAGMLPAVTEVRVDSVAGAGEVAYVSWTLTPDPEPLARVVLALIEGFSPGAVQHTAAELARSFSVSEHASFEIELDGGWARSASFERRVQSGPRLRIERTVFRTHRPDDSRHREAH